MTFCKKTKNEDCKCYCHSIERLEDVRFLLAWLKTQIGKEVRVEFLIGTNTLQDRAGTLIEVGESFIVIRETGQDSRLACDAKSIRFVRVYN